LVGDEDQAGEDDALQAEFGSVGGHEAPLATSAPNGNRHCERSEAIQGSPTRLWIAALRSQ
jgi:hypothetical protein